MAAFSQAGYAVIFLTRKGSIQPFTQQLPAQELVPLLEAVVDTSCGSCSPTISSSYRDVISSTLRRVAETKSRGTLMSLPYTTIFEYLQVGRPESLSLAFCAWLPEHRSLALRHQQPLRHQRELSSAGKGTR